jgi:hypothetical protein
MAFNKNRVMCKYEGYTRRKMAFSATLTYPILLVPYQMPRQEVWTRRGEHMRPAWMQEGRITQEQLSRSALRAGLFTRC